MRQVGNETARDFFVYTSVVTVAAGVSATDVITIQADSKFWLQKLSFNAVNSATLAPVASPNILVLLTDTSSSRQLMLSPVPVTSMFGTGQLPFILPNPRAFMRNGSIQVAYTSFEPANGITIRLALIGFKVYGEN